jgi:8-oxo-dGTP diphosphatase
MRPNKPVPEESRPIRVLAAVLAKDGRWLIAKRKKGDRFAGFWEFPGGKLEPGETAAECLARELFEELGLRVRVGKRLGTVKCSQPGFEIELTAYRVTHLAGALRLQDHEEVCWVLPEEIGRFALTAPDRLLLEILNPGKARKGS